MKDNVLPSEQPKTPLTDAAIASAIDAWKEPIPFPAEHFKPMKELELRYIKETRRLASDIKAATEQAANVPELERLLNLAKYDLVKLANEFAEYRKTNPGTTSA